MKNKTDSQHFVSDLRVVISLIASAGGVLLAVFAAGAFSNAFAQLHRTKSTANLFEASVHARKFPVTSQNFWVQTNGPQGGDGFALATNSSGHVFVGTQGGGVFGSTDNAETWTGINNGLTATNVRALVISPVDHIFAGTFGGIFRSHR